MTLQERLLDHLTKDTPTVQEALSLIQADLLGAIGPMIEHEYVNDGDDWTYCNNCEAIVDPSEEQYSKDCQCEVTNQERKRVTEIIKQYTGGTK